jgi:O-antigen biosynthesis protein
MGSSQLSADRPSSVALSRSASPRVSVVIPTYNCLALTQAMLASLQATLPRDLASEIIFVDDGSTDGTREWLKSLSPSNGLSSASFPVRQAQGPEPAEGQPATLDGRPDAGATIAPGVPAVRYLLNEKNLGYATTNNRGAALARGDYLALLNDDLVLLPRWLEPMLRVHHRLGTRAGLIGNVQLDAKTAAVDHAGIIINRQSKPVHARALPAWWRWSRLCGLRPVPAVTGACVLLERRLWEQLGGLDDRYVNGGEDIDLCFRARAAGRINAVALRSVVRHHVSSSPGRKRRDEENSFRLAQRWQQDFVAAADVATRDWCREYLGSILPAPQWRQYPLACRALLHAAHLRRTPPREAVASLEAELAKEFAHWEKVLGVAAASSRRANTSSG